MRHLHFFLDLYLRKNYLALEGVCWVVLLGEEADGHGEDVEDGHGDREEGEQKAQDARVESPASRDKALVSVDDDEESEEEVLVDDLGGHVDDVLELNEARALPTFQLLPLS